MGKRSIGEVLEEEMERVEGLKVVVVAVVVGLRLSTRGQIHSP
jgi:hypothetical protein